MPTPTTKPSPAPSGGLVDKILGRSVDDHAGRCGPAARPAAGHGARRGLRRVPLRRVRRLLGATTYPVHVQLADSGGIFTGADVTYRGVSVGRVGPLTLTATGVDVQLDIDRERAADPGRRRRRGAQPLRRSASSTSTCSPPPTAAADAPGRRDDPARAHDHAGRGGGPRHQPRHVRAIGAARRPAHGRRRSWAPRSRAPPSRCSSSWTRRRSSPRPPRTRCRRPWPCCTTAGPCSPRRTRPRASSPTSAAASRSSPTSSRRPTRTSGG